MKKFSLLTTTSLMAILAPLAVLAADISSPAISGHTDSYGATASQNADNQTAAEIKAFYMGKASGNPFEPILIRRDMTANGLIGEAIINSQGTKIATVKDIIVDRSGKAILVVVSDHGFLGIGSKVAAFDYSRVVTQNPEGKVMMALSQDMVDNAADFSYDQKDWAKAKVIPANSLSVNALLKGDVFDNNGKKVADVANVYFRNSEVTQIIVGFNRKLGMGGNLAALNFDDLQMLRKNKTIDFKLTASQSAQFENFRESVTN